MALPYTVHPVDVFDEARFAAAFLRLNPNARVPVIVDPGGARWPRPPHRGGIVAAPAKKGTL
jgi:glutathione S-transferase